MIEIRTYFETVNIDARVTESDIKLFSSLLCDLKPLQASMKQTDKYLEDWRERCIEEKGEKEISRLIEMLFYYLHYCCQVNEEEYFAYAYAYDWFIVFHNRIEKFDSLRHNRYIVDKLLFRTFLNNKNKKQATTPSSPIIPQELANPEARAIFNKAIEVGLMRQEGEGYKWVATKRLLAYFADRMSEHLNIGKGMLTDGRIKTSWKPFEDMFQEKGLSVAKKDYQREGQLPIGSDNVDSFFE